MKSADLHPDETRRLSSLMRYEVLDTEDENAFDELTQLASAICQTPISLISLVDENRQWFKSKVGLDATETPRSIAFCSHAILQDKVFEVPNATQDYRFSDNPLVSGAPNIRFYAGAPLVTPDGYPLGTLCVIDSEPKKLTESQQDALKTLSKQVISQLELRLNSRRLERLNRERDQLFSVLAHDLRSPFNAILGLSKILSRRAEKLNTHKVVSVSQSILGSSMRVYQLLDELLQWSQQRMGAIQYHPQEIDIEDLLDETTELLNEAFALKNLTLVREIADGLSLEADATLTKTVLRNVLSNAIKYSPENSHILVTAEQQTNHVIITVRDQGEGIPHELADTLFNDSVVSTKGTAGEQGTGLGLSLCGEFMRMQQGRIFIDPQCIGGTKVVLELPTNPLSQPLEPTRH